MYVQTTAAAYNKQGDQGFNVHAFSLWILRERSELRATRWEYLRMRSTRRLNKPLLPRGAGRRGQGYKRNKKQRGGGEGRAKRRRQEIKAESVRFHRKRAESKQCKEELKKLALQQWKKKKKKVNLKINNPFPAKGQRTSFKWRNLSDRVCHKPARKWQQESAFYFFFPRGAPLQSRSLLYWTTGSRIIGNVITRWWMARWRHYKRAAGEL